MYHVDGALSDGAVVGPDGIEQLAAAEKDTGATHQEFEQTRKRAVSNRSHQIGAWR
jgi:hypothetical protein